MASAISYSDNQPVVALIEGQGALQIGLLGLLNEQGLVPNGSNVSFVSSASWRAARFSRARFCEANIESDVVSKGVWWKV